MWDILASAIGPLFGTHVIIWNVMPFCADCDADSKNRKLAGDIDEADLEYLAELQKLWLKVPPFPPNRSSHPCGNATAPAVLVGTLEYAGVRGFGRVRLGHALTTALAVARQRKALRRVVRRRRPRVAHKVQVCGHVRHP